MAQCRYAFAVLPLLRDRMRFIPRKGYDNLYNLSARASCTFLKTLAA